MGALMTVDELMKYLNVSRPTVYLWVKEGTIPAIKIKGVLRFDRDEVDQLIKSRSTTTNGTSTPNNTEE